MKNNGTYKTALWLLVIGGLNWLLVGIFNWDVGALFGGQGAIISRIIYVVVGLSAIFVAAMQLIPTNTSRFAHQ